MSCGCPTVDAVSVPVTSLAKPAGTSDDFSDAPHGLPIPEFIQATDQEEALGQLIPGAASLSGSPSAVAGHNALSPTEDFLSKVLGSKELSQVLVREGVPATPLRSKIEPKMNAVSYLKYLAEKADREYYWIVFIGHTFISTGEKFKKLLEIGFGEIFVGDKHYSNDLEKAWPYMVKVVGEDHVVKMPPPEEPWEYHEGIVAHVNKLGLLVAEHMKKSKKKPKRILWMIDGSGLPETKVMNEFEGVACFLEEQTMYGEWAFLKNPPPCRWISLASSPLKGLEAPYIGKTNLPIFMELADSLPKGQRKIGFVGFGSIGSNNARSLADLADEKGYELFYYDEKNKDKVVEELKLQNKIVKCESVVELTQKSCLIIGSTGCDPYRGVDHKACINGRKIFVSSSSGCIEFYSLMKNNKDKWINVDEYRKNSHCTLKFKFGSDIIDFIFNGKPVTFMDIKTRKPSSEPKPEIPFIRAGLAAGIYCLAMMEIKEDDKTRKKFYPHYEKFPEVPQQFITEILLQCLGDDESTKREVKKHAKQSGLYSSPAALFAVPRGVPGSPPASTEVQKKGSEAAEAMRALTLGLTNGE